MIIGIDEGHPLNCGAFGNGYSETSCNRQIGQELISLLKQKGHTVIKCTVDNNSGNELSQRVAIANKQHLDLFISLHLDSFSNPEANGCTVYVYPGCKTKLTQDIVDNICSSVGYRNRGVKESSFYVLKNTKAPAILIECGFISNINDMKKFNHKLIAEAIVKSIGGANTTPNPTPNPTPKPPVKPTVTYQVFTNKWLPNVIDLNDYAGIYGVPIQGIYVSANVDIQCRVHTQKHGWLPWVNQREDYAGIYGNNIDGIQINSSKKVKYRVYANGRWLPWVYNVTDYAGIYGNDITGLQIVFV